MSYLEVISNYETKMKLNFTQATLSANCGLGSCDFQRVHEPKTGKIGTFDKNRDPNGQQGPYRDPGP